MSQLKLWTSTLPNKSEAQIIILKCKKKTVTIFPESTDTEQLAFLGNLNTAVLTRCYETHSTNPALNLTILPSTVLSRYQPKYKKLNPDQLQCKCTCENVFEKELVITPEESKFLFD